MIKLQCANGYCLEVEEAVALQLHLLKDNIEINIDEKPTYHLPGITGRTLFKVIDYCKNLVKPSTSKNFDAEFLKQVDPVTLFNLIQAAHHLKISSLMDLTCRTLVNMVKAKTFGEIMKEFNIDETYVQSLDGKRFRRLYSGEDIPPVVVPRGLRDSIKGFTESPNVDSILRHRGKETLINKSYFVDCQFPPFVACHLQFVDRRNLNFDQLVQKLLVCEDFEELSKFIRNLNALINGDLRLADDLSPDAAQRLLWIVKSDNGDIQLKCDAVSTLSRARFDKCGEVMTRYVIPVLVNLMFSSPYHPLRVKGINALTCLASASSEYMKVILDNGALENAQMLVIKNRGICDIIDCVANFLAVVCRRYNLPPTKVKVALTISEHIFENDLITNYHVVQACYALQYLSYEKSVAVGEQLINKLIRFFYSELRSVSGSALGVVGNIARWGKIEEIQILTANCKLLECLRETVFSCELKKFWKEACQIISNIAARTETSIKEMDEANIVAPLCSLLEKDESDVKMEAAWAIFNGIYGNRYRQIDEYLKRE